MSGHRTFHDYANHSHTGGQARLKALARARKMSLNKLIDELATVALANHDAFVGFQALAREGDPRRALELLERLDQPD